MVSRKLPRVVKYSLVPLIVSGLMMILFGSDVETGITYKKIFLATWIGVALAIGVYGIREWLSSAKALVKEKRNVRLIGHLFVLALILWILFEIISGLAKAIIE